MIPIKNFTPIGTEPELPPGYIACEYLESDGEKYIDTGITPGAGYGFSITYYIESPTGTGPSCKLLGSSVYNEGLLGGISISSWENGAYTFFSGYNRKALTFGSKATISFIDGICNWNGETFTCNKESDAYPNIHGSVWIMRVNSDATNFSRNNGRYYNFKTYHYTDVIQNLIPALDSSGVPCMYDTVGKKPYYNQGTGEFSYKLKEEGGEYLYDAYDFVKGECYTEYGNTTTSTFSKTFLDGKTHSGIIYAGNEPTGQYSPVRWTCRNYHILDHLIIGNDVTGTSAASVYGITDDGTYELIGEGPRWTGRDTIVMTKFKPYKKFELRCHRPGSTDRVYVYWIDAYMRY